MEATPAVNACGIYARISSDDGTALGVARQIEDCTREAQRRGWPVAAVFTDNDVSATKAKKRPEYERLLAAVRTGAIDAVVVYDVDRLTRTPAELERFIDIANGREAALASVGGEIDLATPQGRLTARIKGSVARHEVEQMSRRLKSKFQASAAEGQAHGITPFGYRRERIVDDAGRPKGFRDVLHPAEADAVRECYRMLLAGESLRSLAKYLNNSGFRTGRGNAFAGSVVGNMLRRPRYAGHRTHGGKIVSTGLWEPIVSQDTYDTALAILSAPGRRHERGLEPKHLLSGIALCGNCGGKMRPNIGKLRPPSYVCSACMKLTRQMAPVHEVVEAVMIARLSMPDAAALMAGEPEAMRAAVAARDAILARMDSAADDYANGVILPRQFARMNATFETLLADADRAVAAARPVPVLDGMTGTDAAGMWAQASIERKREIIRTLATVTIMPTGPGIRFAPEQVRIDWL